MSEPLGLCKAGMLRNILKQWVACVCVRAPMHVSKSSGELCKGVQASENTIHM